MLISLYRHHRPLPYHTTLVAMTLAENLQKTKQKQSAEKKNPVGFIFSNTSQLNRKIYEVMLKQFMLVMKF